MSESHIQEEIRIVLKKWVYTAAFLRHSCLTSMLQFELYIVEREVPSMIIIFYRGTLKVNLIVSKVPVDSQDVKHSKAFKDQEVAEVGPSGWDRAWQHPEPSFWYNP